MEKQPDPFCQRRMLSQSSHYTIVEKGSRMHDKDEISCNLANKCKLFPTVKSMMLQENEA